MTLAPSLYLSGERPYLEVLVSKAAAIDGLAASAVAAGEVTTLNHEL